MTTPGTTPGTSEVQLSDQEWRERLTPDQYQVLRQSATEPAWSGELLHVDGNGVFHCAGCGAALFSTDAKFDSGSGWPSFDRAMAAGTIVEKPDHSHFMVRTEITCARCGGHLGHLFPDGPTDTGMRYCVNSLALDFSPEAGSKGDGDGDGGDGDGDGGTTAETGGVPGA
ncbi:MAG TPA: peptide-methionine (R)-S-oxide reductase MsrB [Acidimicrobiales bacterium]|nr:peptide-methionine (R)-S-oxide reductase MsrB [Acidimicrobiales bacterium]